MVTHRVPPNLKIVTLKVYYLNLETTSRKLIRGSFQRLQQLLEFAVTVGSCGDCWTLRQLLDAVAIAGICDGLPARPAGNAL